MVSREIHKKTGQVVFDVRRTGGRKRYDKVTYIGKDANGNRVEISAAEYRKFIPAYSVGDVIEAGANFRKEITRLTRKSANVCVAEITLVYLKDTGINRTGSTKTWTEEFDGRIV